jgi:hypothetical protein
LEKQLVDVRTDERNGAEPIRVPKYPLHTQGIPDGVAVAVVGW